MVVHRRHRQTERPHRQGHLQEHRQRRWRPGPHRGRVHGAAAGRAQDQEVRAAKRTKKRLQRERGAEEAENAHGCQRDEFVASVPVTDITPAKKWRRGFRSRLKPAAGKIARPTETTSATCSAKVAGSTSVRLQRMMMVSRSDVKRSITVLKPVVLPKCHMRARDL